MQHESHPVGLRDAKTIVEEELAANAREALSQGMQLPKLARLSQTQLSKMTEKIDSRTTIGLPKVGPTTVMDKMQAARRGAAIMGALGHPGLEKMLEAEELDKMRRKQRMQELGRQTATSPKRGNSPETRPRVRVTHAQTSPGAGNASSEPPGAHLAQSGGSPSAPRPPAASPHGPPAVAGAAGGGAGNRATHGAHGRAAKGGHPGAGGGQHGLSKAGAGSKGARGQGQGGRGRAWRRGGGEGGAEGRERGQGVRAHSRVGRLLAEFGVKDDWVSKVILRHQLATILQANVRGWLARLRWHDDKHRVVQELQRRLHLEATAQERSAKLRLQLQQRTMTRKNKEVATSALKSLFGQKAMHVGGVAALAGGGVPGGAKWGRLKGNADLAKQLMVEEGAKNNGQGQRASEAGYCSEGSEFSDLEMEDITAVKLRARTPPWQKLEESQWVGQYRKLTHRQGRGKLDVVWSLEQSMERLGAARARRLHRQPDSEGQGEGQEGAFDPCTESLPPELITDILYPKYVLKYGRLGLLGSNPLQRGDGDALIAAQAAAQAASQAAAQQAGTAAEAGKVAAELPSVFAEQQGGEQSSLAAAEATG